MDEFPPAATELTFRSLVQAVTEYAIFALDPRGIILTWNKGAERLKGYQAAEIIGRHFSVFYTAADIESKHPEEELKIAFATGRFEEEGWRLKKDGSRFWGSIFIQKIVDENGQFMGYSKVTRDLTAQREALNQLTESEERFRLLVANVQDYGILTLDPQGYVVTWNLGAERIKGYKAKDIIGQHFSRFYTAEDLENDKPGMELRVAAEEGRFEDEGWRVRKDKGLFWANVVITALRNEKGILRGFAKVTRDLTARRQSEEALRQSQERYRLLVNNLKDYAVILLDTKGRVTSWNTGATRIQGYEAKEIVGRNVSRFYTPEAIAAGEPEQHLSIAVDKGRYEQEDWRVTKEGVRFWAEVVITPILDDRGDLRSFAHVTRDITSRRKVDVDLRRSEERLRQMIEGVRDYAIFMLSADGMVTSWNEGAQRIKQYQAPEIIGQHFSRFYQQEDIDKAKPAMELRVAGELGRFEDEGWRVRKDGSKFWANVILTAVRDKNGTLLGYSKITRDLTERKRAEEKMRELNENLERKVLERTAELTGLTARLETAVKARDEFLSVASHELKTPLTSLKLQVQMRKRATTRQGAEAFPLEALRNMADDDEKQISRLIRLVDDMLDITRLASGKLSLNLEKVDLSTLVDDVAERMQPQLEACGCQLSLEHHKNVEGVWDPYRLEQVLTNLLTNAMKYGAGKPIRVVVSGTVGSVELAVEDHGLGISPKDQNRVFEQFERVNPSNAASGLGLGLYIVRQIVEEHGGHVHLKSKLGEGSTFMVELPKAGQKPKLKGSENA